MAVRLYNEYIKVDPNFIPVFSRNSDRIYPDKWQSFYPHTSFKNILKDVVETLEKSNETKDRSIWMSGAYGTGKTYASFVIKHILEDSIDSIAPYFIQNGIPKHTVLAKRILLCSTFAGNHTNYKKRCRKDTGWDGLIRLAGASPQKTRTYRLLSFFLPLFQAPNRVFEIPQTTH